MAKKLPLRPLVSGRQYRMVSLAVTIPAVMMVSPLVGFFLGRWVGGLLDYPRAGALAGLLLGLIAGARETVRMIRQLIAMMKE
ncbi:AtpZ/AtpI family protein [bacterium]|nr:AtpZ/AtpI family protein [bacterium]